MTLEAVVTADPVRLRLVAEELHKNQFLQKGAPKVPELLAARLTADTRGAFD